MRDHVHILGASGCGTSTLGRALADARRLAFLDADDFFWEDSDPPYQRRRALPDRQQRLVHTLTRESRWVLAGSICGWGDPILRLFDLVVFVSAPASLRLARLSEREWQRFGNRIAPGGDMFQQHRAFLEWAAAYDEGPSDMRSRQMHEAWLAGLSCPVLRVDGSLPVDALASEVTGAMIDR